MSQIRSRKNPMKAPSWSSSTGSKGNDLLLVDCPTCGIPVIKLWSRKPESHGKIFFKCENNIPNDSSCEFFKWEKDYVKSLSKLEDLDEGVGGENVALKNQLLKLQHQVHDCMEEISVLKNEVCGLKQLMEAKSIAQCDGSKALVVAMCVGVILGIIVATLCK